MLPIRGIPIPSREYLQREQDTILRYLIFFSEPIQPDLSVQGQFKAEKRDVGLTVNMLISIYACFLPYNLQQTTARDVPGDIEIFYILLLSYCVAQTMH